MKQHNINPLPPQFPKPSHSDLSSLSHYSWWGSRTVSGLPQTFAIPTHPIPPNLTSQTAFCTPFPSPIPIPRTLNPTPPFQTLALLVPCSTPLSIVLLACTKEKTKGWKGEKGKPFSRTCCMSSVGPSYHKGIAVLSDKHCIIFKRPHGVLTGRLFHEHISSWGNMRYLHHNTRMQKETIMVLHAVLSFE